MMKKFFLIMVTIVVILMVALLAFAIIQGNQKFESNEYVITDAFNNISITDSDANIILLRSTDNTTRVVCNESSNRKHLVAVNANCLIINPYKSKKAWYNYINLPFKTPKITIYLSNNEYESLFIDGSTGDVEVGENLGFKTANVTISTGDVKYNATQGNVKITTSTGDVKVSGIEVNSLEVTVSTGAVSILDVTVANDIYVEVETGDVKINDATCKNLISDGDTGYMSLVNVISTGKFIIERSTGDINFERCDASEIDIETDTGAVKGSLLSEKIFIVETDTGNIDVPRGVSGGVCEVTTDTGDIKIVILS